jgi:hypothetical protein
MMFGRFLMAVCAPDGQSGTQPEVISQFGQKAHCALMLIGTSEWWQHYEDPDRDLWEPENLGEDHVVRRGFPRCSQELKNYLVVKLLPVQCRAGVCETPL